MSKLDLTYWKSLPETQKMLSDISQELAATDKEILAGYLMASTSLDREYCHLIGKREGLLMIVKLLEANKDVIREEI